MNRTRSSLVRRKLALESLEERWTPATGSTSLAWLGGLRAGAVATVAAGTGTLGEGAVTAGVTTPSTPARSFNSALRSGSVVSGGGLTSPTTPVITTINYFNTNYLRAGGVNSGQGRAAIPTGTASGSLSGTVSTPTVPNVSLGAASSTSVTSIATTTPAQAKPTVTTSDNNVTATVPANVSGDLATAYLHSIDSTQTVSPSLNIVGSNVNVSITGTADGDFNALVTSLRNLGMQIQSSDATYHAVRGMLPISQIPAAAAIPQVLSMSALRKPILM